MKHLFKEHIQIEIVENYLNANCPDPHEREHLQDIVDDIIFHKILDSLFDELAEDQKLFVLQGIDDTSKHSGLIDSLKTWIVNFEDKLHLAAASAQEELLKTIEIK